MITQNQQIWEYLSGVEGRATGLTALQSDELFGIRRLASRIHELKREGHPIGKDIAVVKNRHGQDCRVARYWLVVNF
jgi:hypothetical protein